MEKDKLSYEELENQIANLKKQIEILSLNSIIQNEEKGKRAAELSIANIELDFQNEKKVKRAAELIIANIELAFQNEEKKKRAAELINSNIKLAIKSKEKEKLEAGLTIANLALVLQSELIIAKEKAEESERYLQIKNEELKQTNDELLFAKEKAEENEAKFRAVAELSPMAIYSSSGSDQKATNINEAFYKIFGFSMEDVPTVGHWWIKAFPDEKYRQQVFDQWVFNIEQAGKNSSDVEPLECVCTCKNGSEKIIVWVAKTIGDEFWAFGYDITERKQAELLLQEKNKEIEAQNEEYKQINEELQNAKEKAEESERTYRMLFESINDAVYISEITNDGNTGKFIRVNDTAYQRLGYSREELLTKTPFDINSEKAKPGVALLTKNILETKHAIVETEHVTKDGRIIPVEISTRVTQIENKTIFHSIARDITERKKAEQALRESREKFSKIFDRAPVLISITDIQTGIYIDVNDYALSFSGFSKEEVIGHKSTEVGWINSENRMLLINTLIKKGRIDGLEMPFKTKTGKQVYGIINGEKIILDNKECLLTITTDVSERKQIELLLQERKKEIEAQNEEYRQLNEELQNAKEKAEESGKNWQTTFDAIYDIVILLDTKHEIININKAGLEALHKPLNEVIGKKCFHLVHNRNCPIKGCPCEISLNEKRIVVNEYAENNKIYELIAWPVFDTNNEIKAFTHIVKDITERKQAENLLREKDIQFRKLSANVHDLIFQFTRKPDGTYYVPIASEGIKNIFGCSPEDVLEDFAPIASVILPEDAARVINDIEDSANHLTYFTCEFRVKIPGKPIQWIYSRSTPEKLPDGSITWYGFNADITERKKAELLIQEKTFEIEASNEEYKQLNEELQFAKEKAEESDKLKSSFLKNMSHEVRTPLNAIVGFSHIMARPNQSPEKLEKFSNLISENSQNLIEIITDVIEVSQIEANLIKAELTEIDIVSFIKYSVNSFSVKAREKNIPLLLNMDIPFAEYYMLTDIEKLNKTFKHIIDNALKFTAKGSVEIDCNVVDTNGRSYLQLSITDTGIGIPQEMLDIIFQPFRQIENGMNRNFGGNGLGLPIAKAYLGLLNGSISIKSEPNKGTTVSISMPVNKSNNQIVQKEKNKQPHLINTILIAEDEYSNYQYLLELLSETGLKILHATNGKEALDMCKNNSSIDLVLMDIKMPVMDGYTATKLIKAFKPKLPVIAQTAFAMESEKKQFKDVFDAYITKPIDEVELMEILKVYIDNTSVNSDINI